MQFFHFGTGNQLIQQINSGHCMQYSDSVEQVFVAHDSITKDNYSDYSAILSCTPNGAATALANFALTWGSVEIAGTPYWGFYCYLSSLYTQIAGPMACNLVVSSLTQVIVSQTFSIMINAASSSTNWSESITQAQWKELMNYVSGLKIPNLGTVNFVLGTAGSIIDNYYGSENAGAYYFTDTSGESYLLLVGYSGTTTTQSLYYIDTAKNVFATAQRTYNSGATTPEWSAWSEHTGYLPISGGTMLGPVNFGNYSSTWVNGTNSAVMNPTYLEFATSAGTTMYEYGEILFNGFAFALPAITEDSILATEEWVGSLGFATQSWVTSSIGTAMIGLNKQIYSSDITIPASAWTASTDTASNTMMIYADSTDFPNVLSTDEMSFIAVDSIDPTGTFSFGTDSQAEWGLLAKISANGVVTFYCKYLTEAPTAPITMHVEITRKQ